MKKFLAVLLALFMLFGAVLATACGKKEDEKMGKRGISDVADELAGISVPEKREKGTYEEIDNDSGNKTVSEYDNNGNLVKETLYDSDGNESRCIEYEYNKDGKISKRSLKTKFDEAPSTGVYKYNSIGKVSEIKLENFFFFDLDEDYNFISVRMDRQVFTYDKSGKILSSAYHRSDNDEIFIKNEYTYDEVNRKITATQLTEGIIDFVISKYYSDSWKLLKTENYDENGNMTNLTEYYENGNVKYIYNFSLWGSRGKSYYNENGQKTESFSLDSEGNEEERTTYEYNDAGYLIKETTYDVADGLIKFEHEYAGKTFNEPIAKYSGYSNGKLNEVYYYNENRKIIESFRFDEDGKESYHATYQYNEAGYLIKKRVSQRSSYSPDVECEYAGKAENEHEIKKSVYSLDGKLVRVIEYDANGKLVRVTEYDADGNIIKTEEFD